MRNASYPKRVNAARAERLRAGCYCCAALMNGYPEIYNIESDPCKKHCIGENYEWVLGPLVMASAEHKAGLETHPNPPAANIAGF